MLVKNISFQYRQILNVIFKNKETFSKKWVIGKMEKLPDLPYDYDALEPHIDAKTMRLHHDKHHQGYTDNFNNAIKGTKLENKPAEKILADLKSVPKNIRTKVRQNGGGFVNHKLFWKVMCPASKSGEPTGELKEALNEEFDSFKKFKEKFSNAAGSVFGSGWAWLTVDRKGNLQVETTPNQDTPLSDGRTPILGLDVWEHSYYKKYSNRRGEYIQEWWNVVNWDQVQENYRQATS